MGCNPGPGRSGPGFVFSGLLILLCGVLLAGDAGAAQDTGKGFFRVVQERGKYWLIDPGGRKFYSMGINCVLPGDWSPKPESPKYRGAEIRGGEEKWAEFTTARLRSWGFNTIAGWSHKTMEKRGIPYCVSLHLAPWDKGRLVDVWDPGYAKHVSTEATKQVGDRKPDDPGLIGYFLDNELPWMGKAGWYTDGTTLLDLYLALPADAPGRREADRVVAANGKDRGKAAEEFSGKVARRFMELTAGAVRKLDSNHLILGVRFANWAPDAVVREVGKFTDVVTLNWYVKNGRPNPAELDRYYLLTGKPVMITEFSYRAMENRSGLKNSRGADVTVPTQEERASRYTRYVETLAALPQMIGFHWFQYSDQPTMGRFDGEDCNYGIVDQKDEPYEPLLSAMREFNAGVVNLHSSSPLRLPGPGMAPRRRPYLPVAGVDVRRETGRRPFPGLTLVEYPGTTVKGNAWADEAGKSEAKIVDRADRFLFAFVSGPGWGCGFSPEAGKSGPFSAAGATRLRVIVTVPRGVRFSVGVTEDGAGPRDSASFQGTAGADGEEYWSEEMTGTGEQHEIIVDLGSMNPSEGYGNPAGNLVLDAQAFSRVNVSVRGGQGKGEIELKLVRFE
jgi:hypothetical protein